MLKLVWGSPRPAKTQPFGNIEHLSEGKKILPIQTASHAKDLTCVHLPEHGYFFSGDLFISRKIKLLRSDENLLKLLESIEMLKVLGPENMMSKLSSGNVSKKNLI